MCFVIFCQSQQVEHLKDRKEVRTQGKTMEGKNRTMEGKKKKESKEENKQNSCHASGKHGALPSTPLLLALF